MTTSTELRICHLLYTKSILCTCVASTVHIYNTHIPPLVPVQGSICIPFIPF